MTEVKCNTANIQTALDFDLKNYSNMSGIFN